MKNKLMILMLVWQGGSFATVNIAEEVKEPNKKQLLKVGKEKISLQTERNKPQIEIEGYVDSNYVRVIVDTSEDKLVTGQMFRENGKSIYVYGEFVNDELHLYDPKGKHFTVIMSKE